MAKLKYFIIIAAVFLALAGFGYFKSVPAPAGDTSNAPRIEITPEDFNFGQVKYGQVLEYDFKLMNSGKEPLEITRVSTSCGCTTAKVASEKIEPGQEVNLKVVYNTGAMSGSHGKGQQERIIYVRSNDPINPQETAMIYANVQ